MKRVFLVSLLLIAASTAGWAQGTTSRMQGVVTDPSGAGVPGASIDLVNQGTNAKFTAKTSDNGTYFFESLASGEYTLLVEAKGFRKFSARDNRVAIGQPTTVNITLEVGAVTETIEVSGSAEVVQTSTSGNLGNVYSQEVITDLPIVGTRGRNPLDLIGRQPGVVSGANTGGGVYVNGARDRAWNYTIDGIDANETSAGGSNFAPIRMNPDSLAEFKILTGNSTAEYGRNSGGQVAMVTKSGSNAFHGTAFWFYRTPLLNANEFQNNLNNLGKRQFVQQIPGASVGGPIIKNKLFYYGNVQFLRTRESSVVNRTVYTQTARQGNFRYVIGGRNQPAGTPTATVDANGNVLPGFNIGTYNIPANDPERQGFDSTTQGLITPTPLPNNFTGGDGLNTALYTWAALQREKQYDVTMRFDYIINSSNVVFARISFGRQDTTCDSANGGLPFFPGGDCVVNTQRDPKNYAFNWRITPSSTTTNEFVFGYNGFAFNFVNPQSEISKVSLYGAPVTIPQDYTMGNLRRLKTLQFIDNFSWIKGAHNIRFGTNLRYGSHQDTRGSIGGFNATQMANFDRSVNTVDASRYNLPLDINTAFDRPNLESSINYMLGRVGVTNRGFTSDASSYLVGLYDFTANFNEYDFYVQDNWKVRRNLVVDIGLRWEAKMAPTNAEGRIRRPNAPLVAGAPALDNAIWEIGSLYRNDWNNLAPSFGVAWDPQGNGKMSLRANYRIAYDRINTFVLSSAVFQNLPGIVIGLENQIYGQNGGRLKNLPAVSAPPNKPSDYAQPLPFSTRNITVVDPNFETPTTQQWALSFQREVARNTVFEANYIGRRGYNLFGAYNANQTTQVANGFYDGVRTVQLGGESALINQLMGVDTRKTAAETGSQALRRIYVTELRNNSLGAISQDLSRRTAQGRSQVEAAGLGRYYFLNFPQFASAVNTIDSNDFSTYNALQLQIERRFSKGLAFQFSYTFSKSIDTRSFDPAFTTAATGSGQSASSTPSDIYNRRSNYALSDFDRTHIYQTYGVWELPFGRGQKWGGNVGKAANLLIGGWQVTGLGTWGSGRPFSAYSGFFNFNNVVSAYADCVECDRHMGQVANGPGGVIWFFDQQQIAQFRNPALGVQGNTGRNYFRGPWAINFDMAILKRLQFSERYSAELRADASNITNTVSFGFPTTSWSSTTFGRIRDTVNSSSRKIQLGAKFYF